MKPSDRISELFLKKKKIVTKPYKKLFTKLNLIYAPKIVRMIWICTCGKERFTKKKSKLIHKVPII